MILRLLLLAPILMSSVQNIDNTKKFRSLNQASNVLVARSNLQNKDLDVLTLWISNNIHPLNNSAKEITNRFSLSISNGIPQVQSNQQNDDSEALRSWISRNIHPLNNSAKNITNRFSLSMPSNFKQVQNNLQDGDVDALRLWISNNIYPLNNSTNKITSRFSLENTRSQDNRTITDYCETPTGEEGRCVSVRLCKKDPDEADPEFIFKEAADCHYTKPCCPLNQILQEPKPTNKLPPVCGVSNPGGYNFITRSDDVQTRSSNFSNFAEFPWMVALLTLQTSNPWKDTEYIGGGTLIHPSVVLTVAHKVKQTSPNQIKCRAGEWDTTIDTEILSHQDRVVTRIVQHERSIISKSIFNAALLFLESPFNLTEAYHISVACLAPETAAPGTICYSMGWGQDLNHKYATTLKKIKLTLKDNESCTVAYRRVLNPKFTLHPSLMCAMGEDGDDTRIGDGGSPLVCALPNYKSLKRYAVHGMVAYGIGDNAPGYYVKVSSILEWINRAMAKANLDKDVMYNT